MSIWCFSEKIQNIKYEIKREKPWDGEPTCGIKGPIFGV